MLPQDSEKLHISLSFHIILFLSPSKNFQPGNLKNDQKEEGEGRKKTDVEIGNRKGIKMSERTMLGGGGSKRGGASDLQHVHITVRVIIVIDHYFKYSMVKLPSHPTNIQRKENVSCLLGKFLEYLIT
eukprot:TRINITY_DN7286_c0_g1_i1.p1 TRINITY_DN7286_c0_g1~~TRINITY_DN7286_c0_g1_i1.p1  ORF type:complete len:128 (-),score=23.89 TRINITY_DN7286_c0_g1_i1:500-883(-)